MSVMTRQNIIKRSNANVFDVFVSSIELRY